MDFEAGRENSLKYFPERITLHVHRKMDFFIRQFYSINQSILSTLTVST